jgi:MFS family permease
MICRFIGGCFASAPLGIVGGALADFWDPVDRGVAVCVFAAATFIGPVGGPIIGYVCIDVSITVCLLTSM